MSYVASGGLVRLFHERYVKRSFVILFVLSIIAIVVLPLFSGKSPQKTCSGFAIVPSSSPLKHPLCFVTRVHNYGEWLPEWIEYHAELGVSQFFIAEDCSDDKSEAQILDLYRELGLVTFFRSIPGNECGSKRKPDERMLIMYATTQAISAGCDWIGVLDADEFVTFVHRDWQQVDSLLPVLAQYPLPVLKMAWWVVGSGGHEHKKKGLQIENFNTGTYRFPNAKMLARASILSSWAKSEYPMTSFECLTQLVEDTVPSDSELLKLTHVDGSSTIVTKSPIMLKHFMYRSYEEYARGRGSLKLTSNDEPNPWANKRHWESGQFTGTFDPSAMFTTRMAQKVRARFAQRHLPDAPHQLKL